MRRSSALLSLACLTLAACAADEPPPPQHPVAAAPASTAVPPSAPPPAARDDGRLPKVASAQRYELSLLVDPSQPRFSGAVRILVAVAEPTSYVVLHARDVNVTHAAAQVGNDIVVAAASSRPASGSRVPDELVLTFERPLPAGTAVLDLTFDAPFGDSLSGLYRVKDGDRWYAFTQFEATDARRAFPCFDEPGQKVPFDVRITAPRGLLAVSNMPETARRDRPVEPGAAPTTTFEFATTPPLPTYLVAFAVGDFDVREGERAPLPMRLITTKGKSGLGQIALDDTAALVKEGASYFGVGYPYPKLDIVAVPNFAAGAMENAGLITFREELLLLDPAHAPQRARMASSLTIAHELAHQWFGDLVTTAWWDDLWLNEGFATWAQTKLVEPLHPGYHAMLESLAGLSDVMMTDSLRSARAVRQPVRSTSEALEAFDGITYQKGAAVLRMIEHAIGADAFHAGVEAYLRDHAWQTATAGDLFRALDKASQKDVTKMAAGFLDRPGVPTVRVSIDCKPAGATLTLSQRPWRFVGQDVEQDKSPGPWVIPTDLLVGGEELRVLLQAATDTASLTKCPAWVDPNKGALGYYHYELDEKGWTAFAEVIAKQPEPTRVLFVRDAWAQVRAGALAPDVFLRVLPALDSEPSRVVVDAEIDALYAFAHELVGDAATPAFAAYVAARLGPHMRALPPANGKAKASLDDTLERRSLFRALGTLANDATTLAEANKLSLAWLADPNSVDGDLARVAVPLGSRKAGPERIEALRLAVKGAKTPNDRKTAILGLSGFEDPEALAKALAVALTDDVPTQDVAVPLMTAVYTPYARAAATDWIITHWDGVHSRLPGFLAGRMFSLTGRACSKEDIGRLAGFFSPKSVDVEGSARPLAEAIETAALCTSIREKDQPAVDRFFKVASAKGEPPRP